MKNERSDKGETKKWVALVMMALMILAAIVTPVLGQGKIDSEGTATGSPGGFTGTVLDSVTGQPIPGVFVQVFNGTGGPETGNDTTAANGSYSVIEADNGDYEIQFSAVNYTTYLVPVRTVAFGDTYYLNVSLEPLSSTVKGTVVDAFTMEPVEGVMVDLYEVTSSTHQQGPTDVNGTYSFLTLTRDFMITTMASGMYEAYSGTSTVLPIASMANEDIDLSRTSLMVSGHVSGNGPIVGARVSLTGPEDHAIPTDDTGNYSMMVPWGAYDIMAMADGYYLFSDTLDLPAGSDVVKDIPMTSAPASNAQVFGYVKDSTTMMPINGAMVCFVDQGADGGSLCDMIGLDGYFHLDIYAAYFEITVVANGYIGHSSFVSITKDSTKNIGDILMVTTPPRDNVVRGKVTSGAVPVAGATVTFNDDSTMTNETGEYTLMLYDGTFDAMVSASNHFPLLVSDISVESSMTKDFALVMMPASDLTFYGYVKDADDNPIAHAIVKVIDKDPTHGGYMMETTTSAGGFYTFSIYAGDFLFMVDAKGFDAKIMDVTVSGDTLKNIMMDGSAAQPLDTSIVFENWDNITIKTVQRITIDIELLRYEMDKVYGNDDGNVTQAEVDAWLQIEIDKGPTSKDTQDMLDVDGVIYDLVDGTFGVTVANATGSLTSTEAVTLTKVANFTSSSPVPDTENHTVTYNATFDDAVNDNMDTIMLPDGWESRNITSEHVSVAGTFEVTIDPPMISTGLDFELVILNVTGNSAPVADAGKNRTIKVNENETFDATGSSDDFGITNYTWDFGDGEMAYGSEVVHMFGLATGQDWANNSVTLTVMDTAGVSTSTTIWVMVDGASPGAKFTSNETKVLEDVGRIGFDASGSTDNVGIQNYSWDFDDSRFGYGEMVNHSWRQPGDYVVTLNVTDDAGWWSITNMTITVEDGTDPVAIMTSDTPPDNRVFLEDEVVITFNGSRSTDNVDVVDYKWDLGDGTTISGEDKVEVNHTYTAIGDYNVTLTVFDASGNSNTTEPKTIKVEIKPKTPDLEILSIKTDPSDFGDGDTITIKIKVINNGEGDIGPGNTNENYEVQFSYGKHKIEIKHKLTLQAGQTDTIKVEWTAKQGSYKICADADWANRIGEDVETNNKACTASKDVGWGSGYFLVIGILVVVFVAVVGFRIYQGKQKKKEKKERLKKRKSRK